MSVRLKLYYLIYLISFNVFSQNLGEITIYNTSNSGLTYNQVNCLEFSDDSTLWIGTQNKLNILENNTEWWSVDANTPGSMLGSNIIKSLEWAENISPPTMFIGTTNGITTTTLDSWEDNYGWSCDPNNGIINTLLYNDKLWAGSTDGLCVEGIGGEGEWLLKNTENGFYSNNITSIKNNNTNTSVAIGTMNGGLVIYENDFQIYYTSNSDILDNTVLDVAFDQNNNIIICTPQAGLGVLTENGSWIWFNTINSTLPSNSLKNVIVDNNNNLWISTLEDGLIYYTNNSFYHYNTENSALPDNIINCLILGPENNLWLGTDNAGLVKITTPNSSKSISFDYNTRVYPTIFNFNINIEILEKTKIQIYNEYGQLIDPEQTLYAGLHTINTENYTKGIYILKLKTTESLKSYKLIKHY